MFRAKSPRIGRPLADSAIKLGMGGVSHPRSEPRKMILLNLAYTGVACYEVMDEWRCAPSWQDRPETLARAQADFGTVLLTTEIIASNPPPWSSHRRDG